MPPWHFYGKADAYCLVASFFRLFAMDQRVWAGKYESTNRPRVSSSGEPCPLQITPHQSYLLPVLI